MPPESTTSFTACWLHLTLLFGCVDCELLIVSCMVSLELEFPRIGSCTAAVRLACFPFKSLRVRS